MPHAQLILDSSSIDDTVTNLGVVFNPSIVLATLMQRSGVANTISVFVSYPL